MDDLLQRALEAPDDLSFIIIIDVGVQQKAPLFVLVRELCYTLQQFRLHEAAKIKGNTSPLQRSAFRDTWLSYKASAHSQLALGATEAFLALQAKAFAVFSFGPYDWEKLESSVPPFDDLYRYKRLYTH